MNNREESLHENFLCNLSVLLVNGEGKFILNEDTYHIKVDSNCRGNVEVIDLTGQTADFRQLERAACVVLSRSEYIHYLDYRNVMIPRYIMYISPSYFDYIRNEANNY